VKKYQNQVEEIKKSGLFDEVYYLANNPDVKENPIVHYLMFGAKENRNPSPNFDTAYYLKENPDVAASDFNPLIHYIRHGKKEGRRTYQKPKYFLTMAACMYNEGKYIEEWLAYHIVQGVEHFYLNNDGSTDDTNERLKPFIKKGYVILFEGLRAKGIAQCEFYDLIIHEKKHEAEWCCFFDIDEFFQGEKKLKKFLLDIDSTISGIELSWKLYGDSFLEKEDGRLVIERFIWHGTKEVERTKLIKSICRLRNTQKSWSNNNPHQFIYHNGYVVDALGKDLTSLSQIYRFWHREPIWDNAWVNHYHTKTREEYTERLKSRIANAIDSSYRKNNLFDLFNHNDIKDNRIIAEAEEVKRVLKKIKEKN